MQRILTGMLIMSSAISLASPANAAYTLYTGDAGGFVANTATAAYLAAQGAPTEFISFDTLADGTTAPTTDPIDGSLFSNNVTFSSLNSSMVNFAGPGFGSEIGPVDAGRYTGTLFATLLNPASAVGFGPVNPATISFFDENGSLIQTVSSSPSFGFVGLVGDSGSLIKSIQLTGDFFAIQDFQFASSVSTSGVPEPDTWALMLIGFGAIGVAMRYRRRLATRGQAHST